MIDQLSLLKDGTHGTHKDGNFAFLLSAKNVIQDSIVFDDSDRKISEDDFNDIYANYHIKKNDVLLTIVGTIGRVALFPRLTVPVAFQRSVAILRTKPTLFPYFLALELQTPTIQSKIKARANMSAQAGIYLGDLKKVVISIPKSEEQIEIAMSLNRLTNLIAATQGKLDNLEKIKRALLKHLFDQSMRFRGYSDPWEKRKFGDLYSKTSEKNDGSFGPDKIISVATMSWKTNVRISSEDYLATYNVLRKGDIAFEGNKSKKFSFGRFVENDIGDGIVSHVFVVFRPKVSPIISYWKYFIHNEFVMRNILRKSTIKATMMTNLSSHDFLRQTLCTPSFKEQENIGNFLERLDSLIAATQSKLSSLETLKKALLQGLFI
ncbi:restriction endonuclease subunit S [Lacticaseibacillus rhamnosus]|uniref:restriction endonuclease subunit S n=1 Tax=Lacticaseibacillus rhamnosus TaxID=47715 RepID=UPI001CDAFF5A|nr:restriction endonuclease subunit S [Lacticaseibacillus rhamnosus]WND24684.1 restriction endonuclease subunit S [Lacticaseibacillus rhamnosus]WSH96313.1 restriction endonuclease subunit S [Lacticaseibacillus rhamnosus]